MGINNTGFSNSVQRDGEVLHPSSPQAPKLTSWTQTLIVCSCCGGSERCCQGDKEPLGHHPLGCPPRARTACPRARAESEEMPRAGERLLQSFPCPRVEAWPLQDTRGPGLGARAAPRPRAQLRGDPRGVPARRDPARPCGCGPGKSLRLPRAATCGGPWGLAAGSAPVEVWERRAGRGRPDRAPARGRRG